MIFLLLSPIYIGVNIFFIYEFFKWFDTVFMNRKRLKRVKIIFGILWGLSTSAIYLAFLMPGDLAKGSILFNIRRFLKALGNYHLAVFFYLAMGLLIILLCRLIEFIFLIGRKKTAKEHLGEVAYSRRRAIVGIVHVALIFFITLYGVQHAKDIKVNHYDVKISEKKAESLKIVLTADLHLGYNIGCAQMRDMVNKINAENPDLVLIAGDIFDNEYEALEDPEELIEILSSIQSKYGVYAVYGNHDIKEKIIGGFTFNYDDPNKSSSEEMDEFLEKAHINLLMDEYVEIADDYILYGRPDLSKPGKGIIERKSPEEIGKSIDLSKAIIVMDHEPKELTELSVAGIDLDLGGHTHDGQFFPMNLTSRYLTWENSAGMMKFGNMTSIVTSGVGLFGPNIRIGTDAEICVIDINAGK